MHAKKKNATKNIQLTRQRWDGFEKNIIQKTATEIGGQRKLEGTTFVCHHQRGVARLAFVIPVIQALMERGLCNIRVLTVLPTKELAQQVCEVFSSYAEGTSLKVVIIAGQKIFAKEQASLSEIQSRRIKIIDEADRMIDSMHQSWLSQVTKAVYRSKRGSEAV